MLSTITYEDAARAALDLDLAREVQAGLLPRALPHLATLSFAGVCAPAGPVGGDYYDFLDLGRGYLGIAVGDVSGKGFAAALLMAGLQAHMRSQCALAVEDLDCLLRPVNRLLCRNNLPGKYATLFFAEYREPDGRLRYVNCGHPPALVRRADGSIERLPATATVLGLEEDWDCAIEETILHPGDTLVACTDGVTEAANGDGEEFGDRRVGQFLRAWSAGEPADLAESLIAAARGFAAGTLRDDATVVAARCLSGTVRGGNFLAM